MIVRELTTKLGFQVEKKGINDFNRQIIGFKSILSLTVASVAGFAYQAISGLREIGNELAKTNIVSKKTKISIEDLTRLTEVARRFRISPEQFQGALERFSELVIDASFGMGKLFDYARDLRVEIRKANGEIKKTDEIFFSIAEEIRKISDETVRIRAFEEIFGKDVGAQLSNLFKDGSKSVREMAREIKYIPQNTEEAIKKFDEFEKTLAEFETNWKNLKLTIGIGALPFFNELVKFPQDLFDAVKKTKFQPQFIPRRRSTESNTEINNKIENNININVPQGTPLQQQESIKESVIGIFNETMQELLRKTIVDYPQVE